MKRPFSSEFIPLYLAIALVIGGVLLSLRDWQTYTQATADRRQAEMLREHTTALLLHLVDAETGQRGFLLTGLPNYLKPYSEALQHIRSDMNALRSVLQRPPGPTEMDELESLVGQKLDELELTIGLRQSRGLSAAMPIVLGDHGRQYMQSIRELTGHLLQDANRSIHERQEEVTASAVRLRWFETGALLCLFALLVIAQVTIGRANRRREQLIDQLALRKLELTEAHELLETTLRSIGDAVISTDREGRVTFLNPVAQQLTGWTQESSLNVPLHRVFRILNENTRETVDNPVERVLNSGRIVGLANHTVLVAVNGREIPIDDSAAPIRNATGEMIGAILVFRDVTERRVAERAVEQNRRDLERTNTSLAQVNADLELFANAAGHDLQEPLRAVASFTQLAARKLRSDPETQEYLHFIQAGVARMQAMIRDLLDYSRLARLNSDISQFDTSPDWQPVALEQLVGEALWNLQTAIAESGAVITTRDLPTLRVRSSQLVQLFQNLIGNAIKYRSDRTPQIQVYAQSETDGSWIISVQDNGIGFEMRYAEEIFHVFRRLHGRDQYSGTGIGLAMCKRIAELHGGRIWVESAVGAGSTFHFRLPANLKA